MGSVGAWLPLIVSILGSVVPAVMGATTLGAIVMGLGAGGLLIGGIILFNKYKAMKFEQTTTQENQQNVTDHGQQIANNQQQAGGDSQTISQVEKDRLAAIEALKPKP